MTVRELRLLTEPEEKKPAHLRAVALRSAVLAEIAALHAQMESLTERCQTLQAVLDADDRARHAELMKRTDRL